MRKLSILLLSLSLIYLSHAQDNSNDSLLNTLDTITSTKAKFKFCFDTGSSFGGTDMDKLDYWYSKAENIVKGTEEEQRLIYLYAYWSYYYSDRGDYNMQAKIIHKGKTYLNENTKFSYRSRLMAAEAQYFQKVEQYEKSAQVDLELLDLSKINGDSVSISGTLHNLGICYYKQKDFDKADSLITEAYNINKLIGMEQFLIQNLTMLANINVRRGNHKLAIVYNLEAKKKFEEWGDASGQTLVEINISESYYYLGKKKLAYEHLNKGIELAKTNKLKNWEWNAYSYMTSFKEQDGDYKEALKYTRLYYETKEESINEQSITKLESLKSELNESKLKVLEQKESLQKEQIKSQDEKIKAQKSENQKNRILRNFLIGGVILLALFLFFIFNRLKLTNKQKKIIEEQNEIVQQTNEQLAEKNKDITDSITYAKRIQNAILPTEQTLDENLNEHFVLFKPKDMVSGDFYWTHKTEEITYIAVADCTGHGVPGAMVSVVCHNALDRAVREYEISEPGDILDKTRELVIEQFAKSDENVKDGMDISLCSINNSNNELKFAGAHNPLWILRDGKIEVIKGDKQPIGEYASKDAFNTHTINTEPTDVFYMFSDGYADQFGGQKGKKYKAKTLANFIGTLGNIPLTQHGQKLDKEFEDWKAEYEQLDDVCVIGFNV